MELKEFHSHLSVPTELATGGFDVAAHLHTVHEGLMRLSGEKSVTLTESKSLNQSPSCISTSLDDTEEKPVQIPPKCGGSDGASCKDPGKRVTAKSASLFESTKTLFCEITRNLLGRGTVIEGEECKGSRGAQRQFQSRPNKSERNYFLLGKRTSAVSSSDSDLADGDDVAGGDGDSLDDIEVEPESAVGPEEQRAAKAERKPVTRAEILAQLDGRSSPPASGRRRSRMEKAAGRGDREKLV